MLEKVLDILQQQLHQGVERVFYENNKVATGKTVESINIARTMGEQQYRFDISIGGGYPYIIGGRSAGSPPPPNNELQDWANAVGFTGRIPSLAFFIGAVGIEPVDLQTPIEESLRRIAESADFAKPFAVYLTDELQRRLNELKK